MELIFISREDFAWKIPMNWTNLETVSFDKAAGEAGVQGLADIPTMQYKKYLHTYLLLCEGTGTMLTRAVRQGYKSEQQLIGISDENNFQFEW